MANEEAARQAAERFLRECDLRTVGVVAAELAKTLLAWEQRGRESAAQELETTGVMLPIVPGEIKADHVIRFAKAMAAKIRGGQAPNDPVRVLKEQNQEPMPGPKVVIPRPERDKHGDD